MRSKLAGNGEGWGEKWKGIKRTGVRGKQAAEAHPAPERAAMQLPLSKLTCNLSIFFFFLDSRNHHQVLKRERRNYPGKLVQTSIIISSVPTAFFWRILSSISELEHKRDAFVFRLAGRKRNAESLLRWKGDRMARAGMYLCFKSARLRNISASRGGVVLFE